jgi:prophage regulatory protein
MPTIEAQTGLSKTEIYRRIRQGDFPAPIKLGARAVAWPSSAIEAWIASMVAQGQKVKA